MNHLGKGDDLWGARAQDWVAYQEPQFVPLYEHVFDVTGVGPGVRLVDAGCGAGLAGTLAVARGATVSGFDPSPALLAIATVRMPQADLRLGGIQQPPHEPGAFDLITMFNVAHHPEDPALLRPLHALGRRGARLAATTWGRPEQCDMREVFAAVGAWPLPSPDAGPFGLSTPGRFERLLEAAGFSEVEAVDVSCPFYYPDIDAALRGLLSAAPFVAAIRQTSEDMVREAVDAVVLPFRRPDGSIRLDNVFRCLIARV